MKDLELASLSERCDKYQRRIQELEGRNQIIDSIDIERCKTICTL